MLDHEATSLDVRYNDLIDIFKDPIDLPEKPRGK